MKGLIIKDLYMTAKYCRTNIIISLIFLLFSLVNPDNLFFAFYPAASIAATPGANANDETVDRFIVNAITVTNNLYFLLFLFK